MKQIVKIFVFVFLSFMVSSFSNAKNTLNVYNWFDYIAPTIIPDFEKATGIDVVYDVFETNEILQAKLLSGNSGYDVVVPSNDFIARQIQSGVFMKLDKDKLPNFKNLNPLLMKKLEANDPGNLYSVPYLVDITGILYNPQMIKKTLGDLPFPENDSWRLVFDPVYMSKLKNCGVGFINAPSEIVASALIYMGIDPNNFSKDNYVKAEKILTDIAPYIRYVNSGRYMADIANGNICVAVGWNGDALMAQRMANQAKNDVVVNFNIPKKGALLTFDMLAIPKNAADYENALKFINYLLEPKVMASNTNYIFYGNAVPKSKEYLSYDIANSKMIFPDENLIKNLVVPASAPVNITKLITRIWNRALTKH